MDEHPLLLIVNDDGSISMNADKISALQIPSIFHAIFQTRSDKRVFLKAGGQIRYGKVLSVLRQLELSDLGLKIILLTPTLESAPCAPPTSVRRTQSR